MTGDDSVCGRSGQAFCCLGACAMTRQVIYGSTVRVSRVSSGGEERGEQVLVDREPAASRPRRIAPKPEGGSRGAGRASSVMDPHFAGAASPALDDSLELLTGG